MRTIDRMLTDDFSSSKEGSDRGLPKKAAMTGYANGTLPYYAIKADRHISVNGEFVVVEGVSQGKASGVDMLDAEKEVRVKRFWKRKDGRWQVVIQTLGPPEEELKR